MGTDCFSSLLRWEANLPVTMFSLLLLVPSALAAADPYYAAYGGYGGYGLGYAHNQAVCQTVYDTALDTACHTETDQVCHTEVDTVVETTHVENCEDVVTQVCQQVSQQVHRSSAVVGHSSAVHA